MKKHLRNEEGFTLIEIIAVLVILGILAAVAVPKFVNLQEDARDRAILNALGAVKAQVVMDYASAVLSSPNQASNWTVLGPAGSTGASKSFGDFVGDYSNSDGTVTVTVYAGHPDWVETTSTATVVISE